MVTVGVMLTLILEVVDSECKLLRWSSLYDYWTMSSNVFAC